MSSVSLDLRGIRRVQIEREALMELPESVLLCLFPNGVVLSPQRPRIEGVEEESEDVYYVDVSHWVLVLQFQGLRKVKRMKMESTRAEQNTDLDRFFSLYAISSSMRTVSNSSSTSLVQLEMLSMGLPKDLVAI